MYGGQTTDRNITLREHYTHDEECTNVQRTDTVSNIRLAEDCKIRRNLTTDTDNNRHSITHHTLHCIVDSRADPFAAQKK